MLQSNLNKPFEDKDLSSTVSNIVLKAGELVNYCTKWPRIKSLLTGRNLTRHLCPRELSACPWRYVQRVEAARRSLSAFTACFRPHCSEYLNASATRGMHSD